MLADPPFAEEFSYIWPIIGAHSARLLEPGCSLVALPGHQLLLSSGNALSEHLRLWWPTAMCFNGMLNPLHAKRVAVSHQPAWWFVRGYDRGVRNGPYPSDLVHTKRNKEHHKWQNPVEWFGHWVRSLSQVGEIALQGGHHQNLSVLG